ncbi:MAG: hypothetical protein C4550_02430 [Nitrospiraceae bacterium]|nr:MAG: hypothetical protein C4550_02430 [Nitrospiraceae bacterium]
MERSIGTDKLKPVIQAIDRAAHKAGVKNLRIILCGGLAAIAYGLEERSTLDIDAEVDADFKIIEKLKNNIRFPSELTADISRWSMIDIPEGYRGRAVPFNLVQTKSIKIFLLSPLDLIISKLRVFRDKDIADAVFLIKKFNIKKSEILKASKQSIAQSPPSTELLRFKKSLAHFIKLAYK